VRITTRNKPRSPSGVTPGPGDPPRDFVLCDEVRPLWEDEVRAGAGALSPGTTQAVEAGLYDALRLRAAPVLAVKIRSSTPGGSPDRAAGAYSRPRAGWHNPSSGLRLGIRLETDMSGNLLGDPNDTHRLGYQVDRVPPQADAFLPTEPCPSRERHKCSVSRGHHRKKEVEHLFRGEGLIICVPAASAG
jgi:hypothetical protein